MVGKVGYVYQASNFIYAGYSDGEMYMKDGVKIAEGNDNSYNNIEFSMMYSDNLPIHLSPDMPPKVYRQA